MADRGMVVKWFEFCRVEDKCSTDCPYFDNTGSARECTKKLAKDVLTLLKEREGLMLALEQSNAANEYLNAEVERLNGLLKEQEAEIEHLKRPDCEHAEHDGVGCLGYCGCTQDDEPIESCKRCEKYTGNVYEAVKWDG